MRVERKELGKLKGGGGEVDKGQVVVMKMSQTCPHHPAIQDLRVSLLDLSDIEIYKYMLLCTNDTLRPQLYMNLTFISCAVINAPPSPHLPGIPPIHPSSSY